MKRIGVIIVAGGSGRRYGCSRPKQFLLLAGRPVLAHTIDRFAEALPGAELVVVLPDAHVGYWQNLAARFDVKPHAVAVGGAERFDSVRNGIASLKSEPELIAVQDGVRPLATVELIRRVANAAAEYGAAIPVVAPVDSFRRTDETGSHPVDRGSLRIVQTPQIFRSELLRGAYASDYQVGFTDDASVVEAAGHAVFLCEGERSNLKITAPEDLTLAEALLTSREEAALSPDFTEIAVGTDESPGTGSQSASANHSS